MDAGISASLSGLNAASNRLAVSANNIANINSTLKTENGQVTKENFVPSKVNDVSQGGLGGVKSLVSSDSSSDFLSAFASSASSTADNNNVVFGSNVDLATETVNQIVAKNAYKANLVTLEAQNKIAQETLDIVS